jgi:hypothetical protein
MAGSYEALTQFSRLVLLASNELMLCSSHMLFSGCLLRFSCHLS